MKRMATTFNEANTVEALAVLHLRTFCTPPAAIATPQTHGLLHRRQRTPSGSPSFAPRALTRAAARSMTTVSPSPKYGSSVSQITAPTGVRRRCRTVAVKVAVKGGGFGEPGLDGSGRAKEREPMGSSRAPRWWRMRLYAGLLPKS
jgi:hypothetical protein